MNPPGPRSNADAYDKTTQGCLVAFAILAILVLLVWWRWTCGREVARSVRSDYAVVIRRYPQRRYWFDPVSYMADTGEGRSTQVYQCSVWSPWWPVPVTSWSTANDAFDPWRATTIRWLGPTRFVIQFNGRDTIGCQFQPGGAATWRRL